MRNLLDLPIWMKLAAGALLLAALYGAFMAWRHSIYQEGWDARDATAKTELSAEKAISEQLRAGIREQNKATDALAAAKVKSDAAGAAALKVADATGKRLDLVLGQVASARATTCDDAMPTVDAILKGVR